MKQELFYLDEQNKRILEMINPQKEDKILIIGTGTSPMMEYFLLSRKCKMIYSIDVSKENILNAKNIMLGIKFLVADANKRLPFRNNNFDKIILTEVLSYLANQEKTLSEINRILKRKGLLILSVPKKGIINSLNPVMLFQKKKQYLFSELKKLLTKTNFRTEKEFYGDNFWGIINLYIHCFFKYILRVYHPDPFPICKRRMDIGWKISHNGGTILISAKKLK